jgi:hypothetical protein
MQQNVSKLEHSFSPMGVIVTNRSLKSWRICEREKPNYENKIISWGALIFCKKNILLHFKNVFVLVSMVYTVCSCFPSSRKFLSSYFRMSLTVTLETKTEQVKNCQVQNINSHNNHSHASQHTDTLYNIYIFNDHPPLLYSRTKISRISDIYRQNRNFFLWSSDKGDRG